MLKRPDRRDDNRIPLRVFLNEYVRDRPHRALTTNVSPTGLYLSRVFSPSTNQHLQFGREDRFVQLEFALPGTTDTIWAHGEVRYDEIGLGGRDPMIHGTGVHFVAMARGHQRLLKEYVVEHRRQRLQQILELIRRNRYQ
jgi:hypothetical protein